MATNAFQPAVGGTSRGEANLSGMSKQYAARDMPANKTLKYREKGQHTQEELRLKDREGIRRELEERERNVRDKQQPHRSSSDTKRITSGGTTSSSRSKPAITHTEANIDADDPLDESSSDEETTSSRHQSKFNKNTQQTRTINNEEEEEDDEDDDEEDDDEDDTAELMAELARIKKERAAEAARIEQQKRIDEEKIRTENILKGNPLLNPSSKASAQPSTSEFRVKRRWDDDVVFKNCAKSDSLTGEKRVAQFVNDSLRSDFHRRFMDKYIK